MLNVALSFPSVMVTVPGAAICGAGAAMATTVASKTDAAGILGDYSSTDFIKFNAVACLGSAVLAAQQRAHSNEQEDAGAAPKGGGPCSSLSDLLPIEVNAAGWPFVEAAWTFIRLDRSGAADGCGLPLGWGDGGGAGG